MSEEVKQPTFSRNTHHVHPTTHQPTTPDDNNLNLLIDRESSILQFCRFVYQII